MDTPREALLHRLTTDQLVEVLGVVLAQLGLVVIVDEALGSQGSPQPYFNVQVCRGSRPTPDLPTPEREIAFRRARGYRG